MTQTKIEICKIKLNEYYFYKKFKNCLVTQTNCLTQQSNPHIEEYFNLKIKSDLVQIF